MTTSSRLFELEEEIKTVKSRNRRVEADKAWETSSFRLIILAILTFIFSLLVVTFLRTEDYLLSALSSTIGFIISSQSLPFIKRWWIAHRYYRN